MNILLTMTLYNIQEVSQTSVMDINTNIPKCFSDYGKSNALMVIQIGCFFLWKVVRQSHTDMMSFCMQFEKIGRGLLPKAFWSEGDSLEINS